MKGRELKIITSLFVVAVAGLIGVGYYAMSDMCANTVISSTLSPDGKWNAVLFERSCGATTGFSSQISLLKAENELGNEAGNLFISEGYPSKYTIRWLSNTSLMVGGVNGRTFKKENESRGVKISYE